MTETEKPRCPMCGFVLYKRHEGWVCKNWKCGLFFKLGRGWVLLDKSRKSSKLFFTSKYDFDINGHNNMKKWLELKSKVLYVRKVCEICKNDRKLHVHHILPRSEHPELALDEENLMVLCEGCHKNIHSEDKRRFTRRPVA